MTNPLDELARAPRRFPRARNTDPSSSHEAAAAIAASGGIERQTESVLEALHRFPGSTSAELGHFAKLDRYMVGRRLSELEAERKIRRADPNANTVPCRMSSKKVCRWWPL
jgi:hypothetical protein